MCFHQEAGADTPLLPVGGSACDMTNEANEAKKGGLQLAVTPVFLRSASRNCQAITSVHNLNCLKFGLTYYLAAYNRKVYSYKPFRHFAHNLSLFSFVIFQNAHCGDPANQYMTFFLLPFLNQYFILKKKR